MHNVAAAKLSRPIVIPVAAEPTLESTVINYAELIGRAPTPDLRKRNIDRTTITYDPPVIEPDPWDSEDPTSEWR